MTMLLASNSDNAKIRDMFKHANTNSALQVKKATFSGLETSHFDPLNFLEILNFRGFIAFACLSRSDPGETGTAPVREDAYERTHARAQIMWKRADGPTLVVCAVCSGI